ncbi:copper resistance protein CopC [Haloterrigena sp. SYSU A558-1]|uniref:Copper resistance protein CopC n=1 Tax=Haloterrigena gelatinilytica TaxID=2741724 RepID=A0ABX2L5Y3_9EURY|nr:copper resistance protein CopC [Haloterrigena gelatinilytica]NUC71141.1 copper resistance protein CopC [Haloterrigena gelatinilytica]
MVRTDSLERDVGPNEVARRAWLLVLVAVVVLSVAVTPVAAHAYLSESDPANGEQVEALPDEVTLTFGGDGVQVADVTVTGPNGEDVSGEATVDPDDSRVVRVPLEDAPTGDDADVDGMYTVEWEILADDGHETSGSFIFGVGDDPLDRDAVLEAYEDEEAGADESLPPAETAAKGLVLVAVLVLLGAPVTAAIAVYPLADRDGTTRTVDRRLARVLAGAGAVLVASVVALGLARATALGSLSVDTVRAFLDTSLGATWLTQLSVAAVIAGLLGLAVAGALRRPVWLWGTPAGAIAVAMTVGWTSHSATAIDRLRGALVDLGHVTGAGLWLGGLVVLAVVVPAVLDETAPADRRAVAAGTIRRYSLLALTGVTLAAATGLVLASWHVPDLESLAAAVYGVALSAKTLLVLLALGLGGLSRFVLLRRLESAAADGRGGLVGRLIGGTENGTREDGGRSPPDDSGDGTLTAFARAVRFEVAVLVVVVLLSGLLTSVPTAAVVGEDEGLESATIEREGDVDLELTAIPAEIDGRDDGTSDEGLRVEAGTPVVFEAAFLDGDDRPLESERTVRLLADGPDGDRFEVELEATDDGTYGTVRTLPAEGDWRVRVTGEPGGEYVDEWVDVRAVASAADGATDDHDHDAEGHDHDDHGEDADGDDDADDSPFTAALRVGAVAIGLVGTGAVALEAVRFRGRSD